MFKKQCRPALLDHPSMNLGNLVHQADGAFDADKLAPLFEFVKKGLKATVATRRYFVGHGLHMAAEIVRVFALAQSASVLARLVSTSRYR